MANHHAASPERTAPVEEQPAHRRQGRGAQPGIGRGSSPLRPSPIPTHEGRDKNAFQHGFYARRLPPVEWDEHPPSSHDTLDVEIEALRVLISRLAAVQDEPGPGLKDPDAPFKTLLSASHRLDTLLRIQNAIHLYAHSLEDAHFLHDYLDEMNRESTPLTQRMTVDNLEKLRLRLGGKKIFSPETLQEYASLVRDAGDE